MSENQNNGLTPEERRQIIEAIKSLGTFGGILAIIFVYTPERLFGLFGRLGSILGGKTTKAYNKLHIQQLSD